MLIIFFTTNSFDYKLSEYGIQARIKEFLKCCFYLKRFSLVVNKAVRKNAVSAFLRDLTTYFEGISKLQSWELKEDKIKRASILIFDLKVR